MSDDYSHIAACWLTEEQKAAIALVFEHYGNDPRVECLRALVGSQAPTDQVAGQALQDAPQELGVAASRPGSTLQPPSSVSAAIPNAWTPMHERAPDPDTECVVLVRYTLDRPAFATLDKWEMQREDPTGMGGPTLEMGHGWNDNFESDVIAWLPIPPHPPAEWDQRLPDTAAPQVP